MKDQWIDFKALRAKLRFEQVLQHYGVELHRKGDQHHGFCPLPQHSGKRNSPSFSANLERGIFQCFGCRQKGNVLEFAAYMDGIDPQDGKALREVALKIQNAICTSASPPAETTQQGVKSVQPVTNGDSSPSGKEIIIVNPPLDFDLKGLNSEHPYLAHRGLLPETVHLFGLGFCSRGYLKGRIAIPLHDHKARLIGYAGRIVDDQSVGDNNPRYLFPGKREREGRMIEFRKSLFVYNGFRIKSPVNDLVVVEGFASVWWLTQAGFPAAVATMGTDSSEKQTELIVSLVTPKGKIWIMPDGDSAGEKQAQLLLATLSAYRPVRWAKLSAGHQPTDLSREELKAILAF